MDRFYTETQTMVGESVRKFAEDAVLPAAAAIDHDDVFPKEIYARLAVMGPRLTGMDNRLAGHQNSSPKAQI